MEILLSFIFWLKCCCQCWHHPPRFLWRLWFSWTWDTSAIWNSHKRTSQGSVHVSIIHGSSKNKISRILWKILGWRLWHTGMFFCPSQTTSFAWYFYSYCFQHSCSSLTPFSSIISFSSLLLPLLQFYWLHLSYPRFSLLFKSFTLILQFTISLYSFSLPRCLHTFITEFLWMFLREFCNQLWENIDFSRTQYQCSYQYLSCLAQDQFSTSRENRI